MDIVNGTSVPWRDDGLDVCKRERRIYDSGVLIWTGDKLPEDATYTLKRPAVSELDGEVKNRHVKEWKDPFVRGPR